MRTARLLTVSPNSGGSQPLLEILDPPLLCIGGSRHGIRVPYKLIFSEFTWFAYRKFTKIVC